MRSDTRSGVVLKAVSGHYYVSDGERIYDCALKGSLRKTGQLPVVGDRAAFTPTDGGHGVVSGIAERGSYFDRPLIANVDTMVIVSAYEQPAPDAFLIDRLCAVALYRKVEPVIVFNKCDLGDFTKWQRIYASAGFDTFVVSAETGEGIEELRRKIGARITVFTGNTGVGKSSILNRLFGELDLATGEVSRKLGRGRHTTRHTELFPNGCGGYVADTPGFSSLSTLRDWHFKETLDACFPEFAPHIDECRFTSCTHTGETDCGVLRAAAAGQIAPTRLSSYHAILEELKDLKPWNDPELKK